MAEYSGWMKKHIKGELDHKKFTVKYISGYRKYRYKLVDKPKKTPTTQLFCTKN